MESFGIRIYKEYFNFSAAHFLIFEDGTREELHGHNYQVAMQIEGMLAEGQDMFIDFLHIKPIVKKVCDEIDHLTLLPQFSRFLEVIDHGDSIEALYNTDRWVFPKRDTLILPIPNTSAERLAEYLCQRSLQALSLKYPTAAIQHVEMTVEESRGQCALYRLTFEAPKRLTDILENQCTRSH